MYGIVYLMSTGWSYAQSVLGAVNRMFFSKTSNEGQRAEPVIGLDKLVQRKIYWINQQREVFAQLRATAAAGMLISDDLQTALNNEMDKLGVHLGSPAVLINELQLLKSVMPEGTPLLVQLDEAEVTIRAGLYRDSMTAYDCFIADIHLLLDDTDMRFINSAEGRTWLGFYRDFFNDNAYESALRLVEKFANDKMSQLWDELKSAGKDLSKIAEKCGAAEKQVAYFKAWSKALCEASCGPVSPQVMAKLHAWRENSGEIEAGESRSDEKVAVPSNPEAVSKTRFRQILRWVLKFPATILSKHPLLSTSFLLGSKIVAAYGHAHQGQHLHPEVRDVTEKFRLQQSTISDLAAEDITDVFAVNDVTHAHRKRGLFEEVGESCHTGVETFATWAQTLGGNEGEGGEAVAITEQGKIMVVGSTESFGAGRKDLLVAQYDQTGVLAWAQAMGGSEEDHGYDVAVGHDDAIFLVGSTGSFGAGESDALLIKLANSESGAVEWARTLGGSDREYANGVEIAEDGRIIVVGTAASTSVHNGDFLLAILEADGTLIFAQKHGEGHNDRGLSVVIGSLGQIVASGFTESYGRGNKDAFIMQYSLSGTLAWARTLGRGGWDHGLAVTVDEIGQVFVGGYSGDVDADFGDVFLAKFSGDGTFQWVKAIISPGVDLANAIVLGRDGRIIIAGILSNDLLLAQYSSAGVFEWAQTLGGDGVDNANAVTIDPDGKIVVVGTTASYAASDYTIDNLLVMRLSENGTIDNAANRFNLIPLPDSVATEGAETIGDITPTTVDITSLLECTEIQSLGSSMVPLSEVKALSFIVNIPEFAGIKDAMLTFLYEVELPEQPILGLAGSPVLTISTEEMPWIVYDQGSNILNGLPTVGAVGQNYMTVHVNSNLGEAGLLIGEFTIYVCVRDRYDTWALTYGGAQRDSGGSVAVTPDGTFVITGSTASFGAGGSDVLVATFEDTGVLLRARAFGGTGNDLGAAVAVSEGGKIVIVGTSTPVGLDNIGERVLLAQFSNDCEILSAHTISGWDPSEPIEFGRNNDYGFAVAIGGQGKIAVVGYTTTFHSSGDVLVAQFYSNGTLDWVRGIGGLSFDFGHSVAISNEGNILVVGNVAGVGAGSSDVLLAEYSAGGRMIRALALGSTQTENGISISIALNGAITLVGTTSSYGEGFPDVLLVQLNADWTLAWVRVLVMGQVSTGSDVVVGPQGDITLVGTTISPDSNDDALIAQFRSNGDLVWASALRGSSEDSAAAVAYGVDGKLLIVGGTKSFGDGGGDVLLLKFANDGRIGGGIASFVSALPLSIVRNVTPEINNVTEALIQPEDTTMTHAILHDALVTPLFASLDSAGANYFRTFPPSRTTLVLDQPYSLDFEKLLYPSASIIRITGENLLSLPAWLNFDFTTQTLTGTPTGSVRGLYSVNIVLDQQGVTQRAVLYLDVVNTAPYFVGDALLVHTTGRFVSSLGSSFRDAEMDAIGPYAFSSLNGTLPHALAGIDAVSGQLFGAAFGGDQGYYQFNVTASDPFGGTGWGIITLQILNTAPAQVFAFQNPSPVSVGGEPLAYEFPITAFNDRDNDPISYEASMPNFMKFDPTSRLLTGVPGQSDRGDHLVHFYALDPYGGVANVTIVVNVNMPPVRAGVFDSLMTSPVGHYFEAFIPQDLFTDDDGDTVTYHLVTQNPLHLKPGWLNFDEYNAKIYGIPDRNSHSPFSLQVEIRDGRGGIAFHLLDVSTPNSQPEVVTDFPDQVLAVGDVQSLLIPQNVFFDADQDTLSYDVQPETVGGQVLRTGLVSIASNVLTVVTRSRDQGNYSVILTASDGFGGRVSTLIRITVTNQPPELSYAIPSPSNASAGIPFNYIVDAGNFKDGDQDDLVLSSSDVSGAPLPEWLRFDSVRRVYSGIARGSDRGVYSIRIRAEDVVGAYAEGVFNITVANTSPVALRPLRQQTVSQAETVFVFRIDEMADADGDDLVYSARLSSGEALPPWIEFDAQSLGFTVRPQEATTTGNIPITIVVADGYGGTSSDAFDLTIQALPENSLASAISSLEQYIGFLSGLMMGAIALIVMGFITRWRNRRIRVTNIRLRFLSNQYNQTTPRLVNDESLIEKAEFIGKLLRQLEAGGEKELINHTKILSKMISNFSSNHPKAKIVERLQLTGLYSKFYEVLRSRLIDKWVGESERYNETTHSIIHVMTIFIESLILAVAKHDNRLSEPIERLWFEQTDSLIRMVDTALIRAELGGIGWCGKGKSSMQRIYTLYALKHALEMTICIPDTSTLWGSLKESVFHLLSPLVLVKDIQFIVSNIPSKWYLHFLEAKLKARYMLQVSDKMEQILLLSELQLGLTRASHPKFMGLIRYRANWLLLYGMVMLYSEIVSDARSAPEVKTQVLTGRTGQGHVQGLLSLTRFSYKLFKAKARWIRQIATHQLRKLAQDDTVWRHKAVQVHLRSYRSDTPTAARELQLNLFQMLPKLVSKDFSQLSEIETKAQAAGSGDRLANAPAGILLSPVQSPSGVRASLIKVSPAP